MIDKDKFMLKILQADESNDLSLKSYNFERINNLLFTLTQSLCDNKITIDYHLLESEGKYVNFGFTNRSIIRLLRGKSFRGINKNVNIIDLSSVNSIIRMKIESFVLMFYIFHNNMTKLEKEFRYDIYKLHGLLKQSRFETKKVAKNIISNTKKVYHEIEEIKTRL